MNPDRQGPTDTGEGVRPSDRCPAHAGVDDPPPCRRCKTARENAEAYDVAARRQAAEAARIAKLEAARLEAQERKTRPKGRPDQIEAARRAARTRK